MDIIQMTRELCKALQESEEYKAMKAAEAACDEDAELQDLIGNFTLIRQQLTYEAQKEDKDDEKIAELNDKLRKAYTAAMGNEHMLAYQVAKQDVDEITGKIQGILTMTLNGEDPMTCDPSSCSGNCASCGGSCH